MSVIRVHRLLPVIAMMTACRAAPPPDARPSLTLQASSGPEIDLTWFSVTNLHFRVGALGIVTDGYVTRLPKTAFSGGAAGFAKSDRAYRSDSTRVARMLEALGGAPAVQVLLSGHSHFDHSFDTGMWSKLTGARVIGPRTTCLQVLAQQIEKLRCSAVNGGERMRLSDQLTMWVIRWNHSGSHEENPELHDPVELDDPPMVDSTGGLRPGVTEDFPNGGGGRGYLFVAESEGTRLSWFFQNSASAADLDKPIVMNGVDHGAPLQNLRRAMSEAGLASVDLWIGTGGEPVAALVVPVLKPKAFLPVHWDDFWKPIEAGVPTPYADPGLEAALVSAGVTLVRPAQFMDRWRLNATGVHRVDNTQAKRALGLIRD
jgi:L-ascorbate metabolism protein UlaG (beta-lactamase superfamily)